MITIFHVIEISMCVLGMVHGGLFGAEMYGTWGSAFGVPAGFILFGIVGKAPFHIAVWCVRRKLRQTASEELWRDFESRRVLNYLIVIELMARGEEVEKFRMTIYSRLNSEYVPARHSALRCFCLCFPSEMGVLRGFDPFASTEVCREKLKALPGFDGIAKMPDSRENASGVSKES